MAIDYAITLPLTVLTARRNARIASAVLATAIPSVCLPVCLSVRLSHASIVSKRRYVARCSLHLQIANASSFVETKTIFPRDDSFPLKSWHKLTYPLLIAASLDTFCLVAPHRYELTKTKFNYDE